MEIIQVPAKSPEFHEHYYDFNARSVFVTSKVISPSFAGVKLFVGWQAEVDEAIKKMLAGHPAIVIRIAHFDNASINTFVYFEYADRCYVTSPRPGRRTIKNGNHVYIPGVRKWILWNAKDEVVLFLRRLPNCWIPEFTDLLSGKNTTGKLVSNTDEIMNYL